MKNLDIYAGNIKNASILHFSRKNTVHQKKIEKIMKNHEFQMEKSIYKLA